MSLLRVHSKDLHEHVVSEAGECLGSGLYTDVIIRCRGGDTVHAHRLVLAAVSPYLRALLETEDDVSSLELPEYTKEEIESLVSIIYNGSIDASVEDIRNLLILAHSLFIPVPVSEQLNSILGLQLKPHPAFSLDQFNPSLGKPSNNLNTEAMSMLQQQIFNQYALINGLVEPPNKKMKSNFPVNPSNILAGHPVMAMQEQNMNRDKTNAHLNQIINSSYNSETGSYLCSICSSTYTNKGNFRQHIEKHLKNGELTADLTVQASNSYDTSSNLYHCSICNSSYNHPGNFKQHMLKHEREQRSRLERNPESNHLNSVLQSAFADRVDNGDPSKTYVCEECNRTFKHPGNFKQHMASHNRPQITSPNFASLLKRPMPGLVKMVSGETNGNGKEWDCPECKDKFDKDVDLQTHMKTEHDIEMVIPPSYIKEEQEEDPLEEMKASAQMGDEEAIKALAIAAGEARLAKYHCEVPGCYQSFTTEGWLMRHRQKQHPDLHNFDLGPRIFTCTQCGKEFNKPSKLTQHVKTHNPESHYKYPCDTCGKKFTRPQHVNRHKLLHTGERPHSCNTCDKTFAREDKLKMHMKSGCAGLELDMSIDLPQEDSNVSEEDSLAEMQGGLQVGVVG